MRRQRLTQAFLKTADAGQVASSPEGLMAVPAAPRRSVVPASRRANLLQQDREGVGDLTQGGMMDVVEPGGNVRVDI